MIIRNDGEQAVTPAKADQRAAALPALLWPCWSMRLIPASKHGYYRIDGTRGALAALTLIPGTGLTYQQATERLGGHINTKPIQAFIQSLTADQRVATIRLLTQLADHLDRTPPPIDYTRRRALFTQATVDRVAYTALATDQGWNPPSPLQLHILDSHLTTVLTGVPGPRNPTLRLGAADGSNPLLTALPNPARQFIHHQARQLLDTHSIDEPLTWQPPPPATPHAAWPGTDPNIIDQNQFATAIHRHRTATRPLARLSEATGLSNIHVRLYTEIADLDMPGHQWDSLASGPHRPVADPAQLRHLYHEQQLTLQEIAYRCLTSEPVTKQALAAAGIQVLAHRPRRAQITREWFEHHYLNTGKTNRQAARDAGCSPTTLAFYAKQHGVPFGKNAPAANPFATWPAEHQPPPNVVAACTGRRGVHYVREVLQMARHRTQRAAAAALGLHETVLMRHRQHVERAAAIRIFQPRVPLTPTPDGEQFLHHAATALRRLDKRRLSRHGFSGQVDQVELVDLERKTVATREEEFLAAVP